MGGCCEVSPKTYPFAGWTSPIPSTFPPRCVLQPLNTMLALCWTQLKFGQVLIWGQYKPQRAHRKDEVSWGEYFPSTGWDPGPNSSVPSSNSVGSAGSCSPFPLPGPRGIWAPSLPLQGLLPWLGRPCPAPSWIQQVPVHPFGQQPCPSCVGWNSHFCPILWLPPGPKGWLQSSPRAEPGHPASSSAPFATWVVASWAGCKNVVWDSAENLVKAEMKNMQCSFPRPQRYFIIEVRWARHGLPSVIPFWLFPVVFCMFPKRCSDRTSSHFPRNSCDTIWPVLSQMVLSAFYQCQAQYLPFSSLVICK